MADSFGVEPFPGFGLVRRRMHRAGALLRTRARFANGAEFRPVAAGPLHPAHRAMMLAVSAATGRQIRFRAGAEGGSDGRPTEKNRQRKCNRAAHGYTL